jgi:hypothetical protein
MKKIILILMLLCLFGCKEDVPLDAGEVVTNEPILASALKFGTVVIDISYVEVQERAEITYDPNTNEILCNVSPEELLLGLFLLYPYDGGYMLDFNDLPKAKFTKENK